VRIEAKGREAFNFRPFWRLLICCNSEPENLLVLPPLTEDIADKIVMLRCHRRELPMPVGTSEQQERFWSVLMEELPGLLGFLDEWEPDEDIREERCGVAAIQHPDLVNALRDLAPEGQLEQLIDHCHESGGIVLPWEGTAAQLRSILGQCSATSRDAEKLLGGWQAAAGVYLARMHGKAEKLPISDGIQRWRIR
jgi:hypothetical protein